MFEMYSVPLFYILILIVVSVIAGAMWERYLILWRERHDEEQDAKIKQAFHEVTFNNDVLNSLGKDGKRWYFKDRADYEAWLQRQNDPKTNEDGHFSVAVPISDTTLEQALKSPDGDWFYNANKLMARPFAVEPDYDSKGNLIGLSAVPQTTAWDKDRFPRPKAADEDRFKEQRPTKEQLEDTIRMLPKKDRDSLFLNAWNEPRTNEVGVELPFDGEILTHKDTGEERLHRRFYNSYRWGNRFDGTSDYTSSIVYNVPTD